MAVNKWKCKTDEADPWTKAARKRRSEKEESMRDKRFVVKMMTTDA